jgi:hypothetical protein
MIEKIIKILGLGLRKRILISSILFVIFILIYYFYSPFWGKEVSQYELARMIDNRTIYSGYVRVSFNQIYPIIYRQRTKTTISKDGSSQDMVTNPDVYFVGLINNNRYIIVCDNYWEVQPEYIGYLSIIPSDVGKYFSNYNGHYLPYMFVANNRFGRISLIFISIFLLISIIILCTKLSAFLKSWLENNSFYY